MSELQSMLPSDTVINCLTTDVPSQCKWYSPSMEDRSNPNDNKICGSNKNLCWRDTVENKPREFKCGSCPLDTNSQTDNCHISIIANSNQDTRTWSTNITTKYKTECMNIWRQF
jgi:hypothetical protein